MPIDQKVIKPNILLLFDVHIAVFQVGDLKEARRLATDITAKGASLFDMLGKAVELRVCNFIRKFIKS